LSLFQKDTLVPQLNYWGSGPGLPPKSTPMGVWVSDISGRRYV